MLTPNSVTHWFRSQHSTEKIISIRLCRKPTCRAAYRITRNTDTRFRHAANVQLPIVELMHQTKPSTINHLDTKPTQCLSLDKLTELFLVKRSIPGYCRPIMFQRPANTTAADAEDINKVLNIATAENIQHEVNQLNAVPVVTVTRYCTLCPLHTLPVVTVARYCTLYPK